MNVIVISAILTALFILFMFLITLFLYHRIADTDLHAADSNRADYREELFGKDEIGDLVKSFNSMENALREQMEHIAKMAAEREKVQAELSIATRIQADMIPDNFSVVIENGMCDIYGSMTPARDVGGDFYDFFMLDSDRLCIVIGDVSGKGVPAALFMTKSKIYLKQRTLAGGSISQILSDVNNELCANNREMLFVTVWLGIINTKSGEMSYCNAGHEYPIILHDGKCQLLKDEKNDPPLGLADGFCFTERSIQLQKGDSLFVYTDGVPEAKSESTERYGMNRVLENLEKSDHSSSCQVIIQTMKEDIAAFVKNKEPFDDVTMLLLRLDHITI